VILHLRIIFGPEYRNDVALEILSPITAISSQSSYVQMSIGSLLIPTSISVIELANMVNNYLPIAAWKTKCSRHGTMTAFRQRLQHSMPDIEDRLELSTEYQESQPLMQPMPICSSAHRDRRMQGRPYFHHLYFQASWPGFKTFGRRPNGSPLFGCRLLPAS
jgi:hypothetical protein